MHLVTVNFRQNLDNDVLAMMSAAITSAFEQSTHSSDLQIFFHEGTAFDKTDFDISVTVKLEIRQMDRRDFNDYARRIHADICSLLPSSASVHVILCAPAHMYGVTSRG